jgi:hypothetical protein
MSQASGIFAARFFNTAGILRLEMENLEDAIQYF